MKALDRLAGLLRGSNQVTEHSLPTDNSIDIVIAKLERITSVGTSMPADLQHQAVRRFWESPQFDNLRDASLVSFGLCIPLRPSGPCIMEDRRRFLAVLDRQTGVDQWVDEPLWYRRCYQGLVRSYFSYDAANIAAPAVGKQNWGDLRDYLSERVHSIEAKTVNPDWVKAAIGNQQLFSDAPCALYAEAVLNGNSSEIDQLCESMGIVKESWFLRELVLAQVRQATKLGDVKFTQIIPRLLEMLAGNPVLRDRGLILLLNRYVKLPLPGLHPQLRDAAVEWWGNPWLPSNEMRWGGVVPDAREMVSDWLKREFVDAFFSKLAKDGVGDKRRANFWLRYAKSMDNIQFALGPTAMCSSDRDFVALRHKMKGLITELRTADRSNNAFVMTMGSLVAIEFGGMGNAFYGYDTRDSLPFDMSRPVDTTKNVRNSLKHDEPTRILWMLHKDGIHGWARWEDMFEATLKRRYGISPNTVPRVRVPPPTSNPPSSPRPTQTTTPEQPSRSAGDSLLPYSRDTLMAFARARNLTIEDRTANNGGGNLWVRTGQDDLQVNKVLQGWKFNYKPDKGWWK